MNEQLAYQAPGTKEIYPAKVIKEDDKNITYQNPNSGRQLIISKDNTNPKAIAEKSFEEENKIPDPERKAIEDITLKVETPEEKHDRLVTVTTKQISRLSEIEEIRKTLGADTANTEETQKIAGQKKELQEALTGVREQTSEDGTSHAAVKVSESHVVEILQKPEEEQLSPRDQILKEFAQHWNDSWGKDISEGTSSLVKFSEKLASEDSEFKKLLSVEAFNYHKQTDPNFLSKYKDSLDESGRLIKKDGTLSIYPYMDDGVKGIRGTAEYRNQALYEYARQKGIV